MTEEKENGLPEEENGQEPAETETENEETPSEVDEKEERLFLGDWKRFMAGHFDIVAVIDRVCFGDLAAVRVRRFVPGGGDAELAHADRIVQPLERPLLDRLASLTLVPAMGADHKGIECVWVAGALAAVGFGHALHRRGGAVARMNHGAHRQAIGVRELEVALVVGGDGHDRPGPVPHEDEVAHPDGDLLLVVGVHGVAAGEDAFLLDLSLEAEALFREAYEIRLEVLGPDHKDTLESLSNVAGTRMDQGEFDEAQRTFERVLELAPDELEVLYRWESDKVRVSKHFVADKSRPLMWMTLKVRNKTDKPLQVPALLSDGEKILWDGPNMKVTNIDGLDGMIKPTYPSGYVLDE